MNEAPNSSAGVALREARERLGLSRTQLVALTGASYSQLTNIEAGAVPKHSPVLERAQAVLAEIEASADQVAA